MKTRVEKLCQAFENGKELVEMSQASPHDISNVLKLYLRQVRKTGGVVCGKGGAWPRWSKDLREVRGCRGEAPSVSFGVVGIAGGRGSQPALIDVARAGWCGYVGEIGVVEVRDRDGMDSDTAVGGP